MFKTNFSSISHANRKGLSLVEIMIAMVMTLVVLGAMMAAFSYGSAEMQKGRASIELNNRLITAEEQLRRDLDRITVEAKPHHALPGLPKGFIEIVDGPETDYNSGAYDVPFTYPDPITGAPTAGGTAYSHGANELVYGDRDDYFGCTIKSEGKAFRGRFGNMIVESHLAEVAWFTIDTPGAVAVPGSNPNRMVCRRQLLILPSLGTLLPPGGVPGVDPPPTAAQISDFFASNVNDISMRVDPASGFIVANSLTDLAIRGNRYCHSPGAMNPAANDLVTANLPLRSTSNDIMFTSVAAFDIQVYSPDSDLRFVVDASGNITDVGANSDPCSTRPGGTFGTSTPNSGGFTDLGKGTGLLGRLASMTGAFPYTEQVYDTGTSQYNRNSANDPGANGVDDDGDGVVDEPSEGNVISPFNVPLRGVKFTMRAIEPNTKQVRQLTVMKSFAQ